MMFRSVTLVLAVAGWSVLLSGCSERNIDKKMAVAIADAKQGKLTKAAAVAADIAARTPSAAPLLLQAVIYEKQGDYDKSLDLARQCAAANPEDFSCVYTFGRLSSLDKMRRSEAFGILENALKLNPGDRDTLVLLCNLGTMLSHPRTGVYLEQLRQKPEFATSGTLYYQYGMLRAREGQKNQAVLFLRHSVKNGGASNPALILNVARCMDHYNLSRKEAVNMYKFFLNHPARKKAADIREAQRRIAQLKP